MNEEEMPYFNFAQLKLIVMGLEAINVDKLDDGYREVHKHLLSRIRKLLVDDEQSPQMFNGKLDADINRQI